MCVCVCVCRRVYVCVRACVHGCICNPPSICPSTITSHPPLFPRSTGFILEGFPRTADEASFLGETGLFPDVANVLVVEDSDVIGRVLPPRLDKWKRKRDKKLAHRQRMKEKAAKKRVRGPHFYSLPLSFTE